MITGHFSLLATGHFYDHMRFNFFNAVELPFFHSPKNEAQVVLTEILGEQSIYMEI